MPASPKRESVSPQAPAARLTIEGRGRRVLIADDHEDTRLMLRTILEINRFYVLEAADGQAAVQLAESEQPDIVLMDYSLPILDGLSALRLIRANKTISHLPIIFLSGQAEPAPQIAAREAGCNDYLVKPINLAQMVQLIERRLTLESPLTSVL